MPYYIVYNDKLGCWVMMIINWIQYYFMLTKDITVTDRYTNILTVIVFFYLIDNYVLHITNWHLVKSLCMILLHQATV